MRLEVVGDGTEEKRRGRRKRKEFGRGKESKRGAFVLCEWGDDNAACCLANGSKRVWRTTKRLFFAVT